MEDKLQPEWKYQLLGLRGLNKPPVPRKPALLVIDMQKYFCQPDAPAYSPDYEAVIVPARKLIGLFEALKLPIFATRYYSKEEGDPTIRWWGATLEQSSPFVDLDPRLELPDDSVTLDKHLYGTFSSTDLHEQLQKLGCDSVVICGVMTDLCCETTAREAFQLGYLVYFVGDATATKGPMLHFAALATLAHGFAYILTVDEVLNLVEGENV